MLLYPKYKIKPNQKIGKSLAEILLHVAIVSTFIGTKANNENQRRRRRLIMFAFA